MTPKQRLYAGIEGRSCDRSPCTPIFMAWAAHFIGKTYRDYYLDGQVLADAQIAVAEAFGTDQVSAISDPWREASAYGMSFDWPAEGVGVPHARLLNEPRDVSKLRRWDPMDAPRTRQRVESVATMAERVGSTHSVLGWVEGPMAEYADLRGVEEAMLDLFDVPEAFHRACEVIVPNAIAFAEAQVRAGADMIGVGDAAASLVGPELFTEHVLPWQQRLFEGIHAAGARVKLHICGNIGRIVEHLPTTGADLIDLDWMVPVDEARRTVGPDVALAGNFDPATILLRGSPDDVAAAARKCLAQGGSRFVLQPGCEVPPGTPEENLRAFCPR